MLNLAKNTILAKNGKKLIIILTSLLTLGLSGNIYAQEITVQAPEAVLVGDNFNINYTVQGSMDNFTVPSFKGFSVLGKSRNSFNFNGNRSITISITLQANHEGTFTVEPASCTSNGKKLSSKSCTIKVAKPTAAQLQQRQQQQQQQRQQQRSAFDPFGFFDDPWGQQQQQRQQQQQPQSAPQIDDTKLFARATIDKSNPYQGEQVIVTYKIYTQIPISQYGIDKLPGNKGFWAEDLTPTNQQIMPHEETINGRRYRVYDIRKGALFPQQSGTLTIEPLNLDVLAIVQVPRRYTGSIWDIFDDPFFNPAQAVERPVHSQRLNVNVKPLPSVPDDFSNAVGSFSVKGGLSLDSVKAGEAVSYKLTVSGRGNLMLITPPTPQFPKSFETYDPQIQDNINRGANGVSGSRTFEWVLIPREDGTFSIPAYKFIFFDPSSGQYKTLTIDAQPLIVLPGENIPPKQSTSLSTKQSTEWTTYLLYFLSALALIFILVVLIRWLLRKYRSREIDPVAQRKRNALRIAQRRLKKASAFLAAGEAEPFYEEIYRAIWGCLSDKYSIPTSQLNRDTVTNCLLSKQVPEQQQQRILQLLKEIDLARFAPGEPAVQMQNIYQQTLDAISEI